MLPTEFKKSLQDHIENRIPALITIYNINTGQYLYVNKGIKKLLGYSPSSFLTGGIKFATSIVHLEDLARILAKNQKALLLANSKKYRSSSIKQIASFEYRMKHKKGHWIWLHTDGTVFSRDDKQKVETVMNISIDITKSKDRETKIRQKIAASDNRYKTFLSHSTEGIWRIELEKQVPTHLPAATQIKLFYKYAYLAECNDTMAKMYGYKNADDIFGARLGDLLPESDQNNKLYLENFIRKKYVLNNAISHEFDKFGKPKIFQNSLVGIIENGYIARAWGTQRDATKEKKFQERLEFLDKVSKRLSVSLDQTVTLQEITKLVITSIADYCRIAVIDEQGAVTEIAANHQDHSKITLINSLYDSYKNQKTNYGIPSLLQQGKPQLISRVDDKFLKPYSSNKKMVQIVKKIGLKSYMGFPLVARKKIIGAITFSSVKEGRYYTKEDQNFAAILVTRIALALDNFRLYSDAQKAIAIRENFISIASHELKTPVTSLKIFTHLLSKKLKQKRREESILANKIDNQIEKLSTLVRDLLDTSRIQSGKLEFKFKKFDLNKCVCKLVEDLKSTQSTHHLIIKGQIKRKAYGDRNRIEQVITNLINNAIKYSPTSDRVIIKLIEKNKATVSIKDFGIGIEDTHLRKIFDRFYRISTNQEPTFPGLGMGLFIAKEIVSRHGGEIKAVSTKGKGSTFSFSLPYERPRSSQ